MRGQPERILVIIPSPVLGGAEAQTLQIARGFCTMGAEVAVAAEPAVLSAAGTALGGVRPLPAPLRAPEGGGFIAWQRDAAGALLRGWRPDAALVCCPLPTEGFGALLALSEAAIPALAVAHLVRQDWHLAEGEHLALRQIRAEWAAVSVPAARRLEALFNLPPHRVAAIPNGLPPAAARSADRARFGLPEGVPLLVQVGRLDIRKGAQLTPAIAAAIAPALMVLGGNGPLRADLERADGVRVLGHVADVPGLLACADALLLASEHEGCPLSVLEAARAGCPILATRQALEAWPEAGNMARLVLRDPPHIAHVFAEALRDSAGSSRRVVRAHEVSAAWDEEAMLARTAFLLAAACA